MRPNDQPASPWALRADLPETIELTYATGTGEIHFETARCNLQIVPDLLNAIPPTLRSSQYNDATDSFAWVVSATKLGDLRRVLNLHYQDVLVNYQTPRTTDLGEAWRKLIEAQEAQRVEQLRLDTLRRTLRQREQLLDRQRDQLARQRRQIDDRPPPRPDPVFSPVGRDGALAALGLATNAEPEAIQAVYRRLARKYHPDLAPPDERAGAEARMKQINQAYALLKPK